MLNKEDLNQILDRNVAWIENCDSKASIMLGMLGVTISIVFAFDYAKVIISTIKEKCLNTSFWNIVLISSFFKSSSGCFSFSQIPRFLAIFHVLQWTFLNFPLVQFSSPYFTS